MDKKKKDNELKSYTASCRQYVVSYICNFCDMDCNRFCMICNNHVHMMSMMEYGKGDGGASVCW